MIAASHIAPTADASAAQTSSRAEARHDDSTQSFSDSLAQAKQASHSKSENDRAVQSSSTKRSKDSNDSTKARAHRDDNAVDAAAVPQQAETAEQSGIVYALPTHLMQPIAGDPNSTDNFTGSLNAARDGGNAISSSVTSVDKTTGWHIGSPTGNQNLLSGGIGGKSGAILGKSDFATDNNVQDQQPILPQPLAGQQTGVDDAEAKATPVDAKLADQTVLNQPAAQDAVAQAQAAASTSQGVAATIQVNADTQNYVPSSNVTGVSASASATAAKASTALKGLQNIANGSKTANSITDKLTPGAKETDSYLSIQKDAKSDAASTKDSLGTSTQHNMHNEQSQDAVIAPVTAAPQTHTAFNAQHPSVNAGPATIDNAKSTAAQVAENTLNNANIDRAVATSQTAASEHASTIVNSAKLIQTIGQSEMRVGMRTAEFGDISIRTASTRDAISAQISLAHGDLAKTLTASMPEMQTRLTSGETVNVTIQHDGQTSSFDSTQSGSNQSGAQNQSQDGGSSHGTPYESYSASNNGIAVSAPVYAANTVTAGRLDIRA